LLAAERLIAARQGDIRVGQGFGRPSFAQVIILWICGIEIPAQHEPRVIRTADVGLHALTDAVLGAIGQATSGAFSAQRQPLARRGLRPVPALCRRSRPRASGAVARSIHDVCERPRIGPIAQRWRAVAAILASRPAGQHQATTPRSSVHGPARGHRRPGGRHRAPTPLTSSVHRQLGLPFWHPAVLLPPGFGRASCRLCRKLGSARCLAAPGRSGVFGVSPARDRRRDHLRRRLLGGCDDSQGERRRGSGRDRDDEVAPSGWSCCRHPSIFSPTPSASCCFAVSIFGSPGSALGGRHVHGGFGIMLDDLWRGYAIVVLSILMAIVGAFGV